MRSKIRYLCLLGKLFIDNELQQIINSFRDDISLENFVGLCKRVQQLPRRYGRLVRFVFGSIISLTSIFNELLIGMASFKVSVNFFHTVLH